MDKIDNEIIRLMSLRSFLKIQLNSTYGTSTQNNFQNLFDRRNEVTEELNRLYKIRSRKDKINHIINRNEQRRNQNINQS